MSLLVDRLARHRFKFAEVRQEVIEMLKKDLLGPSSENEILNQNPRFEYIVGMLAPQTSENDSNEQEIDGDAISGGNESIRAIQKRYQSLSEKEAHAKKLLKAKNSPVLQMKKNDLLENLKKHSRYKTMFKFEEDHIVISSQKEAAAFIKMLNDDIVRSELTGKEYDSSSKMLLGPVGASH